MKGFPLRLFALSFVVTLLLFALFRRVAAAGPSPSYAFAFSLASATATTAIVSVWLARESRRLAEAARHIARGERVPAGGGAEPVRLATALDRVGDAVRDVTLELRRERELVAGILDGMQEGVLLLMADGTVGLVNAALRDMLLLRSEVVGKPLAAVIRSSALLELVDGARPGEQARSGEIVLEGLKPRRLLVRAAPLRSDARSFVVVFVDLTDLRRLEVVRRDFVANVSHELRTPVAAILTAAETLAGEDDAATRARFLAMIERNGQRLRQLIDDLLDLSRIESKELALSPTDIDLAQLVASVFGTVRATAVDGRVELRAAISPEAASVHSDPRAVEQIVTNLVENAVRYCPGATVTVRSAPRVGGGVTLSVSDTGGGIASKHLTRIFERFYRVDPGRSRAVGGTGLGLSIVKHLAQALGGDVEVDSAVGKGSTFAVHLPNLAASTEGAPAR